MAAVTMELVKELRERTGVGMTKCKAALDEAHGNIELAIENLRKAGMAAAVKKEGRETKEGKICFAIHGDAIALVEVNAETDFVVKNTLFQEFADEVAQEIAKSRPQDVNALLAAKSSIDPSLTIDGRRSLIIQKIGENIQVKRFQVFVIGKNSSYGLYSHMAGKIVCFTEIEGSKTSEDLAKEIGMHIAAEAPQFLNPQEVPQEIIAQEKDIARTQVKGKPEAMVEKIVEGKVNAFYDQVCLLRQKYIKDPSISVEQLVKNKGSELKLTRFARWTVGQ